MGSSLQYGRDVVFTPSVKLLQMCSGSQKAKGPASGGFMENGHQAGLCGGHSLVEERLDVHGGR
ncbi:hypothetical protein P3T43_002812 [Paraburkholderia sp. GAS41]|jgi:hypothetical protein